MRTRRRLARPFVDMRRDGKILGLSRRARGRVRVRAVRRIRGCCQEWMCVSRAHGAMVRDPDARLMGVENEQVTDG